MDEMNHIYHSKIESRYGIYFGARLSFFRMLRWKSEGARHTADIHGCHLILLHGGSDIAQEAEHVLQYLSFSSDISMMAACTDLKRCSLGISKKRKQGSGD